jgi:hypothetical protein
MSKRVALVLSEEALAILDANAGERERGAWVSGVIVNHVQARQVADKGALERVEARLSRLEDAIRTLVEVRSK